MAKTKKELAEQYIALRNKFEGDNIKPGVKVWWRDADHLCKIWKVQDFHDAIERLKSTYHEKLIPAPLDEKNVTTDWIDDIFDDSNCTCNGSTYTGFINDSVCSCLVGRNTIIWKIDKDYAKDALGSYNELQKRLKVLDGENPGLVVRYDTSMQEQLLLGQRFYWAEEG